MALASLPQPAIWMAALGVLSGTLSSYELPYMDGMEILGVNVQQGLLFGPVIAFGLFRWGRALLPVALIAVPITLLAWIAAYKTFIFVTEADFDAAIGGIAAGAVGAAGTLSAGAIALEALRRIPAWLLVVAAGAFAGILVVYPYNSGDENFLVLFVPWQALVAASIGYALSFGQTSNDPTAKSIPNA